jgi:acylphosphatase
MIGRFDIIAFLDFASDRAARLDLELVVETFSTERFEVVVSGQPGLVDAFEMACSLGPSNCLVLEVLR